MRTTWIFILATLLYPVLMVGSGLSGMQSEPVTVDASELDRRADLVGKMVVVDDRVRFYQSHPGQGYDELYLKRTGVVFRLPPALRPKGSPSPMPVVVQGKLGRDAGQMVCDVTALKVLPTDLERLDKAVSELGAKDFQGRKSWAGWAEQRGKAFKDNALLQRAKSLEADALRVEAEQTRGTVGRPPGMAGPGRGRAPPQHRGAVSLGAGAQGVPGQAGGRLGECRDPGNPLGHRTVLSQGGDGSVGRPHRSGEMDSGVHQ